MSDIRFERPEDIPDPVPAKLLIPPVLEYLRVPKRPEHREDTTTPVEVSYCFLNNYAAGDLPERRDFVTIWAQLEPEMATEAIIKYLQGSGRHFVRAIIRAAVDPDRLAPISMPEVFLNERASYPESDEGRFFRRFIEDHGVLTRRPSS